MNIDLQELIESADKLCLSLEKIIENDKQFSINVLIQLDRMKLNSDKISSNLRDIREYIG